MTEIIVRTLATHISEWYTARDRRNLKFLKKKYEDAKADYDHARRQQGAFDDQNLNASSSRLKQRREQLALEVQLKNSVYSTLALQYEQEKIALQNKRPLITIPEMVAIPRTAAYPQRTLALAIGLTAGAFAGFLLIVAESLLRLSGYSPWLNRQLMRLRLHKYVTTS